MTFRVGIDIGSTATKAAVFDGEELVYTFVMPTGYSSVEVAGQVLAQLEGHGFARGECVYVATGYGRVSVPFADKAVTEITCHGRGASYLFGPDCTVVDIGGQDTKSILLKGGKVQDFRMNDKCSAGTGKFLEIMANRLGLSQNELSALARRGKPTSISSMCTVFAESEVISLIGAGTPREDICSGIVESVVAKVKPLVFKSADNEYVLTGGLCDNDYVVERLGVQLGGTVRSCALARFAGAIGAALSLPLTAQPAVRKAALEPASGPSGMSDQDMSVHAQGLAAGAAAGASAAGQGLQPEPEPNSAVFSFHTTSEALGFERFCRERELPGRLIPVPRSITAGCGYAWCAPLDCKERVCALAREHDAAYQGLFELSL